MVHDLKTLVGHRVINVYDVDSRTYLIRIQKFVFELFGINMIVEVSSRRRKIYIDVL